MNPVLAQWLSMIEGGDGGGMDFVVALFALPTADEPSPNTVRSWLLQLNVLQLVGIFSLLGGIFIAIRKVSPSIRRVGYLLDDWFGEDARPGVPPRPGVMERLQAHDVAVQAFTNHAELLTRLEAINMAVHEVGTDASDSAARVEKMLNRHIQESRLWVAELDTRAAAYDFEVPDWPTLDDG
jgi:hypothetical protein